jgi:hypothetical protein
MATIDRRSVEFGASEPVRRTITVALWAARAAAAGLLILGVFIWTGSGDRLITVHVVLGVVLIVSLWALAAVAARSGVSAVIVAAAIGWSFGAALLGLIQEGLVTGRWHWTVQALHLVVAMAMVAWCQVLAVLMRRAAAIETSAWR